MFIFTHIPKTAGTTFDKSIVHNFKHVFFAHDGIELYSKKYGSFYDAVKTGRKIPFVPDYVHAHTPHGIHKLFDTDDVKYLTILREPFARTVSSIRHAIGTMGKIGLMGEMLFQDLRGNYKDDKLFLEQLMVRGINCNAMTLQLSGCVDLDNIVMPDSARETGIFFSPYLRLKEPYRHDEMEAFLEKAKENLKSYAFIGLQKTFNSSLKSFGKRFGLSIKSKEKQKSTKKKSFKVSLEDPEVEDILKKMNEYDLRLYEHVLNGILK